MTSCLLQTVRHSSTLYSSRVSSTYLWIWLPYLSPSPIPSFPLQSPKTNARKPTTPDPKIQSFGSPATQFQPQPRKRLLLIPHRLSKRDTGNKASFLVSRKHRYLGVRGGGAPSKT